MIRCKIFGHKITEPASGVEHCTRCDDHAAYYYDGSQWTDRERNGLVQPLRELWYRLRNWTMPRCDQCGKSLLFRRKVAHDFCSRTCHDEWIPF